MELEGNDYSRMIHLNIYVTIYIYISEWMCMMMMMEMKSMWWRDFSGGGGTHPVEPEVELKKIFPLISLQKDIVEIVWYCIYFIWFLKFYFFLSSSVYIDIKDHMNMHGCRSFWGRRATRLPLRSLRNSSGLIKDQSNTKNDYSE